jgi:hypothetical protein
MNMLLFAFRFAENLEKASSRNTANAFADALISTVARYERDEKILNALSRPCYSKDDAGEIEHAAVNLVAIPYDDIDPANAWNDYKAIIAERQEHARQSAFEVTITTVSPAMKENAGAELAQWINSTIKPETPVNAETCGEWAEILFRHMFARQRREMMKIFGDLLSEKA